MPDRSAASRGKSQFGLLRQRRFAPFFFVQFLGAFNDNLFKNALVALLTYRVIGGGEYDIVLLVNLAAGLFILPFFLFSATFGQFADKYEKSGLIRLIKILEIAIMALAVIGFLTSSVGLLMVVLFLMGTQSTLFGPIKYGILPQLLDDTELVGGNGMVETGTYLAILFGVIAGGAMLGGVTGICIGVVAMALLGYLASAFIPKTPATDPGLSINWNPVTETWRNIRYVYTADWTVFQSVLGIAWFWFYGAVVLAQMPVYAEDYLGGGPLVFTLLITMFSVGIGAGSLLCERLSGHRVELGLVPFGSIGLTVFGIDLYLAKTGLADYGELLGIGEFLAQPGSYRILLDLVLIGAFGGFYIVPLYALVQQRTAPAHRSRVIAGNNIISAFFMVLSAAMAIILLNVAGLTIPQLFLVLALLNAAVAVYIYTLVPEFLMRFIIWLLIHTMYRVRTDGLEKLPEEGPAVLVCNHVSFVDALIIGGMIRRPVRFVMYHKIFRLPVLNFVFRTAKAIPIAPAKEDEAMLEEANRRIDAELAAGNLLCIFPEGQITADGELGEFRPGVEKILERNPVPVYPMALRGLWGSFFSRYGGAAMTRPFRRIYSRVELVIGEPLPAAQAGVDHLRERVLKLRGGEC